MKCLLSPHPIPSGKVAASQLALIGSLIVSCSEVPKEGAEPGSGGLEGACRDPSGQLCL